MRVRKFLNYKLLPIVVAVFFGLVLFNTVFVWSYIVRPAWIPLWIAMIAGVIVYALITLFIWYKVRKLLEKRTIESKTEKKILLIFFAVLILAQIIFASQMHIIIEPQCILNNTDQPVFCLWDFNQVTQTAIDTVIGRQNVGQSTLDYLKQCPNNIPIFFLLVGMFKLGSLIHIENFAAIGIGLNILAIDLTLLIMYLIARKLFGLKKALFSLVIAVAVLPLAFFYVPIFYTDTLSLPFLSIIIYLYLQLRESKSRWRFIGLLLAMTLLAFAGALIKATVAIVLVAIIIDMLMRYQKKAIFTIRRIILSIVVIVTVFAALFMGYNAITNKYITSKVPDSKIITLPWTHFVMMGMHGTGGYDMRDMIFSLKHDSTAAAQKFNVQVIQHFLQQYGFFGYLQFLHNKVVSTWTDSAFESLSRLQNGGGFVTRDYHPSWLQEKITATKEYPLTLYNYMQGIWSLLLVGIVTGAVQILRTKNKLKRLPDEMALLQLSIMGLAFFLLIWEANTRYIINFLPIIILLATPVLWKISRTVITKCWSGYKKIRLKILKY